MWRLNNIDCKDPPLSSHLQRNSFMCPTTNTFLNIFEKCVLQMCQLVCFPFIINPAKLNEWKLCLKSHWLDAESGRSPNNGCTLHQWEHPFQQSVPHMALRPLLQLYPGRGSHSCFKTAVHCKLPGPRINCFDPIWPSDKGRLSTHTYWLNSESLCSVWGATEQVTICARSDAGDMRLDNAFN